MKRLRSSKSPNWVSERKMRNSIERAKGFKDFMRRDHALTERHGFTGRDKVFTGRDYGLTGETLVSREEPMFSREET